MKLQGFRRLIVEDLPAESKAIGDKFASVINPFAEEVVNAINGKLSITDNLNQKYKEVSVQMNSNGTPRADTAFQHGLIGRCRGISVEKVENLTNVNVYPTSAPFITFTESGGLVTVKHITGLQVDYKWKITLLCKGE